MLTRSQNMQSFWEGMDRTKGRRSGGCREGSSWRSRRGGGRRRSKRQLSQLLLVRSSSLSSSADCLFCLVDDLPRLDAGWMAKERRPGCGCGQRQQRRINKNGNEKKKKKKKKKKREREGEGERGRERGREGGWLMEVDGGGDGFLGGFLLFPFRLGGAKGWAWRAARTLNPARAMTYKDDARGSEPDCGLI
ncbi:hypothetical protein TESG_08538 [Trichophyton tonsurans CBS 112818]|uniref:Uncharacterized protein n=1 Tax=Trichophyton tonsurans (strain CBS 112818) TaxID=647933 RepID=F2S3Y4_TRIT1|nr:hypothetical protein TESG_08538 [Trichophyton tonsurans CBS 112818]